MTQVVNEAPVIAGKEFNVVAGVSVDSGTMFSASDANGDAITHYKLWDDNNAADSGYYTVNGVRQDALREITVTAAQLSTVRWVGGSRQGADLGWVQARDRYEWGEWDSFTAVTTGFTNNKPVATGTPTSVTAGLTARASNLFSVSDADGDTITAYRFWDSNTGSRSGYFSLNGVAQSAAKVISVGSGDLSRLTWHAGSKAGTDKVFVQAFDGKEWGAWASWDMTTSGSVNQTPVVTGKETTVVNATLPISLSSLFSVSDADGDAITQYQFWDSNGAATSGYITVGGVRQGAAGVIGVTASQLDTALWYGGTTAGSDAGWVRAYDGKSWSDWESFTVKTEGFSNNKPVVRGRDTTVVSGLSVNLSSLFSVSDADGDTFSQYQLWDSGSDVRSGYFSVKGERREAARTISLLASDYAETSWFGGAMNGTETVWARAFDGKEWSDWSSWTMTSTRSSGAGGVGMAASSYDGLSEQRNDAWSLAA